MQHLRATIYTAPGLVPGLLGAAIGLMAILLMLRALRARRAGAGGMAARSRIADHWRLIATLVLCARTSRIGLVGHGLPFWLAAAIFIAVVRVRLPVRRPAAQAARSRAASRSRSSSASISGLVIHYVFQDVFLVRLP